MCYCSIFTVGNDHHRTCDKMNLQSCYHVSANVDTHNIMKFP